MGTLAGDLSQRVTSRRGAGRRLSASLACRRGESGRSLSSRVACRLGNAGRRLESEGHESAWRWQETECERCVSAWERWQETWVRGPRVGVAQAGDRVRGLRGAVMSLRSAFRSG